jgi:hypothetical protein
MYSFTTTALDHHPCSFVLMTQYSLECSFMLPPHITERTRLDSTTNDSPNIRRRMYPSTHRDHTARLSFEWEEVKWPQKSLHNFICVPRWLILHQNGHQISLTPSSFSNDGGKMPWGSLFPPPPSYWNIDTEGTLNSHPRVIYLHLIFMSWMFGIVYSRFCLVQLQKL